MGIFDRLRKQKATPPRRRSYAGANTGRLFADFLSSTRSSDSELKPALRIIRNRCRELARNDEYVRRYLGLLKTNVVGPTGVNLQAKARNADGSLDAPGNKIVENAWGAWGKRGQCTADGRLSFTDAQRLFIEALARDGEVLVQGCGLSFAARPPRRPRIRHRVFASPHARPSRSDAASVFARAGAPDARCADVGGGDVEPENLTRIQRG